MEKITQDLFYDYRFLANLNYNPAKTKAVFVVSQADPQHNSYHQHLWLYADQTVSQLTSAGQEANYWWEDDEHLLFSAKRDPESDELSTDIYRLALTGGEAIKAFNLPLVVDDLRVLPAHYLVSARVNINYPDYYRLTPKARQQVKEQLQAEEDYQVIDEYPYYFNGRGYINAYRNNLFLIDKQTLAITPIMPSTLDVDSFDVSGCQCYIVFSGVDYQTFRGKCSKIYLYNIHESQLTTVYDQTDLQVSRVFFYQHGIAVAGTFGKTYGAMEAPKFYRLADQTLTLLCDNEGSLYNSVGTDCHYGRLKGFLSEQETPYFLNVRDAHTELLRLTDSRLEVLLDREGSLDDFTLGQDHILIIGMYDQRLPELYRVQDRQYTQVTHFNDAVLADRYVAVPQRLQVVKVPFAINGWVLLPKDYDPAQRYPAILDIHGGPKAAYGETFFHEMQYWASLGYFVFFCNPRGGDGRGNAFADLRRKFGTVDYEDLMDFTELVLATYPAIDPQRVAVTGGSYGGFMTNWIIGHTDRFACAVSQRSIANWITEVAASDYGIDFVVEQNFPDPFSCHDELWQMSPLKYAVKAVTPTLFIHSYEDYRCLIQEAMQMYTVLKTRGIDAKIVGFKGENHELSRSGKPLHRSRRLAEITGWINKYTTLEKEGQKNGI